MEGKLIKKGEGVYELFRQGFLKGSTDHDLIDSLNAQEAFTINRSYEKTENSGRVSL